MKFVSIPYNDFIYEIFIYEMLYPRPRDIFTVYTNTIKLLAFSVGRRWR